MLAFFRSMATWCSGGVILRFGLIRSESEFHMPVVFVTAVVTGRVRIEARAPMAAVVAHVLVGVMRTR
jgi:hypothetical protein